MNAGSATRSAMLNGTWAETRSVVCSAIAGVDPYSIPAPEMAASGPHGIEPPRVLRKQVYWLDPLVPA